MAGSVEPMASATCLEVSPAASRQERSHGPRALGERTLRRGRGTSRKVAPPMTYRNRQEKFLVLLVKLTGMGNMLESGRGHPWLGDAPLGGAWRGIPWHGEASL